MRPRLLLVLAALVVVLAAFTARTFVVRPLAVASGSMSPTICQGDWVFVDVWDHEIADLSRGDLVAVRAPGTTDPLVKRVTGLPGDTVAINDALLYVNKQRVDEPYVDLAANDALYYGPVVVPDDSILVLGDARASSVDSRAFGPVPADGVLGRVLYHLARGHC